MYLNVEKKRCVIDLNLTNNNTIINKSKLLLLLILLNKNSAKNNFECGGCVTGLPPQQFQ